MASLNKRAMLGAAVTAFATPALAQGNTKPAPTKAVVTFNGLINQANMRNLQASLLEIVERFDRANVARAGAEIILCLNSYGGSTGHGIAMHNFIAALPVPCTTHNLGKCYSTAGILFLAGKKRSCEDNAFFKIHHLSNSSNLQDAPIEKIMSLEKDLKIDIDIFAEIYAKTTKIGKDESLRLLNSETYINAEEAYRMGLTTEKSGGLKLPAEAFFHSVATISN